MWEAKYPLLEKLLAAKGLPHRALWTIGDIAGIFEIHPRTIQQWVRDGKLGTRNLPGRARCLSEDLEQFLRDSRWDASAGGEGP
jgi:Helix-turn-helix domain